MLNCTSDNTLTSNNTTLTQIIRRRWIIQKKKKTLLIKKKKYQKRKNTKSRYNKGSYFSPQVLFQVFSSFFFLKKHQFYF